MSNHTINPVFGSTAAPPLPVKFTDPQKSGLKVTITDDGRNVVINME